MSYCLGETTKSVRSRNIQYPLTFNYKFKFTFKFKFKFKFIMRKTDDIGYKSE